MALRQTVGEIVSTLLSIGRTRLELFLLEADDQKARLVKLACMAVGALWFLTLAILVFSLTIALYFWPTEHRYLALGLLTLLYAVLGLGLLWAVRRALVNSPPPFSATLDELRRDVAMIERLHEPGGRAGSPTDERPL